MKVGPIALADHESQLLDLIKKTPIPGAVSYHYERPTTYDAFANTQGSHFQLWGAREENQLLGFTQITYDRVTWNNTPVQISYSGDTRVLTKARGRKISDLLIQEACNQKVPVFGAVLASNKLVLEKKIADWDHLGIHFKTFTKFKALLYRPATNKKSSSKILCRSAHESDLPAMYHLWQHYSLTRNLPRYYENLESFSNSYFKTDGVNLENTFLVFDGVALIAMLTVWNQFKIRQMVVDQSSALIKIASRFIHLPKVNEELRVLYSFQHAFNENHPHASHAMQTLIAKARTYAHASGAHFFSLGLDENDPLFPIAKKSAMLINTANIILDPRGDARFNTSNKPLHFEIGLG